MRRLLTLVLFLAFSVFAGAQESYLSLELQGQRIGYSSFAAREEVAFGRTLSRSDSRTVLQASMLGAGLNVNIVGTTWTDANGRPVRMNHRMDSAGRVQTVEAVFGPTDVVMMIDNAGTKSRQTLKIPTDGKVVDDPLPLVLNGPVGKSVTVYVLDPTVLSFVKNEVRVLGPRKITEGGKEVQTTAVEIRDPRANTTVFLSGKGDLVRVEAPMGIVMRPTTKEDALKEIPASTIDIATETSIRPEPPIENPAATRRLKLRIEGRDLSAAPSDAHQTVAGAGETWTVDVNPVALDARQSLAIKQAAALQPAFTKPGRHMPSDAARFQRIAKAVVGSETNVQRAMGRIRAFVNERLRPNAGIGVLRDANDIYDTREGVCRDYAILTATIARAAGIPTRLASGLVSWDGTFYYHAWVEAFDGRRWVAYDSTQGTDQVSAAHVKLAQGNVEQAFTFTFLGRAKITVLEVERR